MKCIVPLVVLATALLPASAHAGEYVTQSDGSTLVTWPEHICEGATDLELDQESDFSYEPLTAEELADLTAMNDGQPVLDLPGGPEEEPLQDDAAYTDPESPPFEVAPWKAVYYPDGSWEAWHDERCAGYQDVTLVPLDPPDLISMKRLIRTGKVKAKPYKPKVFHSKAKRLRHLAK